MKLRIGHSLDIHQLVSNRPLWIGGIKIDHPKGLLGHSDADVLLHAINEAIIGALGLGDLGTHFPDTDARYKGADSKVLLKESYQLAKEHGYVINNIDSTIFAERPKMRPYINLMRQTISSILQISLDDVNIKATRGETLGFVGREEGIAADATVLLIK